MDKNWKLNIYNSIKDVADLEKQKRLWLGLDDKLVSSYDEDMSMLFDSYSFEDFVEELETNQPNNKFSRDIRLFYDALNKYQGKENDIETLKDKDWHKLVDEAKIIISNWNIK